VVVLGTMLFQHGDGRQRTGNTVAGSPVRLQDNADLATAADEEQMLRLVAARAPTLGAAFEADLRAVNNYIRDAETSARANPRDQMARQYLISAYEQRAMIYEMAMNRSLR